MFICMMDYHYTLKENPNPGTGDLLHCKGIYLKVFFMRSLNPEEEFFYSASPSQSIRFI